MCFLQTHQVFFLSNLSRLFFAPCVTCDVISAQSNQINVSMTMTMIMAKVDSKDTKRFALIFNCVLSASGGIVLNKKIG